MGVRAPWDRTIHASYPNMEIVRYDRQGHWYLEPVGYPGLPRQRVTVSQAAEQAWWAVTNCGGQVFLDRPGGMMFDSRYRKLVAARKGAIQ